MAKKNNSQASYIKVSFELEKGSPEWYAHKAINALGFSQSKVIRQCLGAIYGAKGAMLLGDIDKAHELHEQGLRILAVMGVPVNPVQDPAPNSMADSSGLPVEDVEMDF